MNRLIRLALLMLTVSLVLHGAASATTYYIAANGSDSNSGTSKTSPWLHAPGMPSCTGACAAASPKPGDQFIFRGGDTWHYGTGSPLVGGTWNWTKSGSSGSPIYIGIDQTWYSGSSWARPILNGDNPLSTSFVSSCSYAYNSDIVNLSASYITFDNFEMKGICWNSTAANIAAMWDIPGGTNTNIIFSNNYCHGWTMPSTAADNFPCVITFGGGNLNDAWQFAYNVFDGSDSPHFPVGDTTDCQYAGLNTAGCASGQAINGSHSWDLHGNTFRYLGNAIVTGNCHTVHDNLWEYIYNTYSGVPNPQHPNLMNCLGGVTGDPLYFYNNVIRHTYINENFYLPVRTTAYIFNNVMYDNMNSVFGVLAAGCFRINAVSNSAASQNVYIYNNTLGDASCQFIFANANAPLTSFNGTGNFENNHFIGFSPATLPSIYIINSGVTASIHDNGNEIFQTTAVATAQGYTASNEYSPASASGATVGSGTNLSTSCTTFSTDSELCGGTSDGVAIQDTDGGEVSNFPAITMIPRQTSWDAGAYQFGASLPTPPTGLSAQVQ
jgi:hypothetical protein